MARVPIYKKREEQPSKRLVNNIPPGKVYGEWTVIKKGQKPDYLLCKCACGTSREVHAYSLSSGKSVSCGCLRKLKAQAKNESA